MMIAAVCGCALLHDPNEAIIQVETAQNPAKAKQSTAVGVRLLNSGDLKAAGEKFVQAIAADQAHGPAHNNLGLVHYEEGNLYQAVLAFEQAMELMPHDASVYYNLALTLEAAGKTHQAMDLYWQAVEMEPSNPVFLGNLVRLRLRLGEYDDMVIEQLKDLVLIETRPEWRRWADRKLALDLNASLDRGPETPRLQYGWK